MVLRYSELFSIGVGRELDDLHSVEQRCRNPLIAVSGSYKESFGKIDGYLHEIVAEALVLFGIKNLEKSRGGISSKIVGHFVYFIKNNNRVLGFCVNQRGYDSAGHRSDVGLSMTADLGLIVHTAERNSCILPSECASNRSRDRCFTDAGRAY